MTRLREDREYRSISQERRDIHDVIQTDSVERVLKSETTLNFVSHDHSRENVLDGEVGESRSSHPIGDGENSTRAIRGVTPFGSCKIEISSHLAVQLAVDTYRENL